MKQALYVVIATVLTGILLFLLSRWPVKHTETITGRPEDKLAGQAASIVRAQNAVGTSGNYREQTAKPSNVFRTSRLSIGSGAVTVLEIDHGLPEQLVDTPEMRRGVEHGLMVPPHQELTLEACPPSAPSGINSSKTTELRIF